MSYELKIDPKSRAAGRFIGQVRRALDLAAIEERTTNDVTQAQIASRLGVHRSVINRLLRGEANLTLRSVAEIAWALGWEPVFTLRPKAQADRMRNHHDSLDADQPIAKPAPRTTSANTFVQTAAPVTRTSVPELVS